MNSENKSSITIVITIAILAVIVGLVYIVNVKVNSKRNTDGNSTPMPSSDRLIYVDQIGEQAIETYEIDISGCTPSPKIAEFPFGATIKFVNEDDSDGHEIMFSPSLRFYVEPNSAHSTNFSEWEYPGVRNYRCDSVENAGTVYAKASN